MGAFRSNAGDGDGDGDDDSDGDEIIIRYSLSVDISWGR